MDLEKLLACVQMAKDFQSFKALLINQLKIEIANAKAIAAKKVAQ